MSKFTKEMFEDIESLLQDLGILDTDEDLEFIEDYSGRGMYGKTVNGIVLNRYSSANLYHIGLAVGILTVNPPEGIWSEVDPRSLFSNMDSFGMGIVVY